MGVDTLDKAKEKLDFEVEVDRGLALDPARENEAAEDAGAANGAAEDTAVDAADIKPEKVD